ncbi:MAG: hypothetical protein ACI81P_002657 [Neolewinella sp.]|jgi:hypothetical protein
MLFATTPSDRTYSYHCKLDSRCASSVDVRYAYSVDALRAGVKIGYRKAILASLVGYNQLIHFGWLHPILC